MRPVLPMPVSGHHHAPLSLPSQLPSSRHPPLITPFCGLLKKNKNKAPSAPRRGSSPRILPSCSSPPSPSSWSSLAYPTHKLGLKVLSHICECWTIRRKTGRNMKASKLSPPSCYIRPRIQSCILSLPPVSCVHRWRKSQLVGGVHRSQSVCSAGSIASLSHACLPCTCSLSPLSVSDTIVDSSPLPGDHAATHVSLQPRISVLPSP